jgi:hypothetical protein
LLNLSGRERWRFLPVLCLFLWSFLSLGAQAKLSDWQPALGSANVPGAVLITVERNQSPKYEIYGTSLASKQQLLSQSTQFPLGRLSALLNTGLILESLGKAQWELDENINTYLSDLQVVNPFTVNLSLRHLLQERDGFPELYQGHWLDSSKNLPSLPKLLNYGLKPIVREPGSLRTPNSWGNVLSAYLLQLLLSTPPEQSIKQAWGLSSLKVGPISAQAFHGSLLDQGRIFAYPSAIYSVVPNSDQYSLSGSDLQRFLEILVGVRAGLSDSSRKAFFPLIDKHQHTLGQSLGFLQFPVSKDPKNSVFFRESSQLGIYQIVVVQPHTGKALYLSLNRAVPELAWKIVQAAFELKPLTPKAAAPPNAFSLQALSGDYGYVHFHTQSLTALARLNRSLLHVSASPQGDLRIQTQGEDPYGGFEPVSVWEPIAPLVFQKRGALAQIVFVPKQNGAFTLQASQGQGGEYQRLSFFEKPVFQIALALLFGFIFLVGFSRNFWLYWKILPPITDEEREISENKPPYFLGLMAASCGLLFLIAFPWLFFLETLPGEMTLTWREPLNPWLLGLLALPLFQFFFTAVAALLAIGSFSRWPWPDRLNGSLQIFATLAYAFWLQTWHLIGFQI